jgi:hypothetical protein
MAFALRLQAGVAEVREFGVYRSEIRISSGDVLKIAYVGGAVQYSRNGSVFYTSGATPQYPAFAESAIFDMNGTISNVMIGAGSGGASTASASESETPPAPGGQRSGSVRRKPTRSASSQ